jgi:hypothetical protein
MFPCEACGHPLNVHNPCHAKVGRGAKAQICGCPAFTPDDLKQRLAALTDNGDPRAAIRAALLPKRGKR